MIIKPWTPMPTGWILNGYMAENIGWARNKRLHGSTAISALMIWITLVTQAEPLLDDASVRSVDMTYEGLMRATGLSRKLIADGIAGLRELGFVEVEVVRRFNRYHISGYVSGSWTKLASRALYKGDQISAFYSFHKRAACELHALMLFVYYVSIRNRAFGYSMSSFETIHSRTGVSEKKIPLANSFLLNSGLVTNISKEASGVSRFREPNKYFLIGNRDLFVGKKAVNPTT